MHLVMAELPSEIIAEVLSMALPGHTDTTEIWYSFSQFVE